MTYAGFLLLFLIVPLGILALLLRKKIINMRFLAIVGVLTLVALLYMAPWDHFAATWGLWSWENSRTWGIRWWAIPPEEYLFCILEALLAITVTFTMFTRKDKQSQISFPNTPGNRDSGNVNFTPTPERISFDKSIAPTSHYPTWNDNTDPEDKK